MRVAGIDFRRHTNRDGTFYLLGYRRSGQSLFVVELQPEGAKWWCGAQCLGTDKATRVGFATGGRYYAVETAIRRSARKATVC